MRWVIVVLMALLARAAAPAPSTPPRLLVIGDSISQGLYASSEANAYRFLVADALNAQVGRMTGTTLAVAWQNWQSWGWRADIILVELGTNDIAQAGLLEPDWVLSYGALLDALQATGAWVVVGTIPWAGWETGSNKWLAAERYNGYIRQQAEKMRGIGVADLWAATVECTECISDGGDLSPFAPDFRGDGFHPSDEGHERIAAEFLRILLPHRRFLPRLER